MQILFRTAFLAVFFLIASIAVAQQAKPKEPGIYENVVDFLKGIVGAGDVNQKKCTNCSVAPTAPQVAPHPIDKTIAWLKNHLRCDNHAYLKSQRANLIRAEKEYGISSSLVACLIATESAWDINADQLDRYKGSFNGTFKGLVQSNTPSFTTIRDLISNNPKYRSRWDKYNAGISPNILRSETMHVPQGILFSCPINRCGGVASARDKERIARASIAFVSTYILDNIGKVEDYLRDTPQYGPRVATSFRNSKRTKYLAAAVGYNAGPNTMVDYLPPAAYTQDDGEWRYKLRLRKGKVAKLGEVAQYVDWINSCMGGDPRVGPADRSAHLDDKQCFGDTSERGLRKLLAVRKKPQPCKTDPSPPCTGPKSSPTPNLTDAQIATQSASCKRPPKGPECPK